jgi:uncharacterized protein
VKLVLAEPESEALGAYVAGLSRPLVSNVMLRVEAIRAVRVGAESEDADAEMRAALAGVTFVALDDATLRRSETIEPAALPTLDAVHLVTALDVGAREMVVYDRRLAEAARRYGLDAVSPGA